MATLHGTVNAEASPTTYHFQYGPTTSYGSSAPVPNASAGSGTAPQPVAHHISGLRAGTTYHFRLVAANAGGTTRGPDVTFTTAPPPPPPPPAQPPVVSTPTATALSPDTAMLQGAVDAQGSPASYHFDYGPTPSYGSSAPVPDASVAPGTGPQPVTQQVAGLTPGTTYHFRLVAANAGGTTRGPDVTFTTAPPPPPPPPAQPPVVSTPTFAEVGPRAQFFRPAWIVEFQGTVNPQGSATTYHFEYGTTTSYGTLVPVPDASAGSGTTPQAVTANIGGTGSDTHHFRLVATNAGGTTVSPDAAFTPIPPPPPPQPQPPAVSTGAAEAGPNDVTFQGTVNPQGLPTSYHFDVGPTTSYGTSWPVPDASAGSGSTPQPVTATMPASLEPGSTWHCRIVATNSAGTTPGNDVTFFPGGQSRNR